MAWALLLESGLWHRAGMSGTVSGFDSSAALARPSARQADQDALEYLLTEGEAGALAGLSKAAAVG